MGLLGKAVVAVVWAAVFSQISVASAEDPNALWREYIRLPEDPFLVHGTGRNEASWVKFIVVPQAAGSQKVYFQDGHAYPFHYQGAVANLDIFEGMTAEQFDKATLYREGRKAVLGAVIAPAIWSLSTQPAEYGIQLVGRDPFTREEIAAIFDAIKQVVRTETPYRAFYFPTYEQRATALADQTWLESQGITISSSERWADGNTIYSSGWALGTLKFVEGGSIRDAYLNGQLRPDDILLTDGVPAETPYLAGIITLSPSTPNSHVAILAKTTNVPFLHLVVPEDVNEVRALIGHRICLRAYDAYGWTTVRVTDTDGILDEATVQAILALKNPQGLEISPVTPYGDYAVSADALMPSDIRYVGGKAANFGMLRRVIPDNSPVAAAFSFDLWTDFLTQTLDDGRTLRDTIAARLSSYTYPPADMADLAATLQSVRDLIEDDKSVDFTDSQRQTILSILQEPQYGFDPSQNLRFRSSTNVEDGREFTGAGLYESYSGCLADDLDGDNDGPCRCDPNRPKERGVFYAIRKVFASFYDDNAFLERLRLGIDEAKVGMALLVHHSFPDDGELANGVAEVRRDSEWGWDITLVTQAGAASVTNPEDGSVPEEVVVTMYSFDRYAMQIRQSNLVQLGA
ncbi:MAG: PEP/pyruvate-binding domain-containing protein, partial [Solirubrobacterales bacterium]